ncbi:MAG: hypothetical protein SPH93_12500 [Clostridium sp.]|jgi:hypothetical protein|uniref:hypothetical protein n=1 Tax=Clostridium sp. TaxID=1506 RepID=UPI0025D79B68|nr:hypothetical protein [Clostridium sp.]MDY6228458.1 hypothetical protein [Clostridium sp.]
MEVLLEFIFIIIFEGCFEVISNKKINPIIRRIVLLIVSLFYIFLVIGIGGLVVKVPLIIAKIIFIAVDIMIIFFIIKLWLKVYTVKTFK